MTIDVLTVDEFEDLLDRCGDDIAVWPAEYREAGWALLRTSAAARELVEEAQAMRRAFAPAASRNTPADLAARIKAQAAASPASSLPPRVAAERSARSFRPAIILSCCFVVGFALSMVPNVAPNVAKTQDTVQVDVPALLSGIWQ